MKFINQKSLFKIIGASALATCMLATSLFAFIPSPTQAETLHSNQNPSSTQTTTPTTESTGLITPCADDPVLFTTESGLEIKYGNAASGNLSKYPYFTTTANSTTYTWVILAHNGLAETITPAGIDICNNNELQTLSGVTKVVTSELAKGEMLCLANSTTGYHTNIGSNNWSDTVYCKMNVTMRGYYDNDTFGFGELKQYIVKKSVTSMQVSGTPKSFSIHFFPLDASYESTSYKSSTYLPNSAFALDVIVWGRSTTGYGSGDYPTYCFKNGVWTTQACTASGYVRPAFVIKSSILML